MCSFTVALRDDDTPILLEIQRRLGIGRVYPSRRNRSMVWFVYRKAECLRLTEFLDAYPLRAKKARDYQIWRSAVQHWSSFQPGAKGVDWAPMAAARTALSRGRQHDPWETVDTQ